MILRPSGWTTLSLAIAILVVLLACKKKREPLSFIADPPIVEGRNYTLTVGTAKECEVAQKYAAPKQGFVHIGVEVTFEAKTDDMRSVHGYPMKLKASDGHIYGTSLGQCQPEFTQGAPMRKGQRLHGLMTFEIPENSTSFLLSYEFHASPSEGLDFVSTILKL
jgi:hypothetical protein